MRQIGQAQRAEGRLLAGLEHHAVAAGERRCELPHGHQERVVPGHDGAHHAHRLALHQRQRAGSGGGQLAVHLVDGLGGPLQAADGTGHVDLPGIAHRLAHVQAFEQRELLARGQQQLGPAQQHPLALAGGLLRPAAVVEGGATAEHGGMHLCGRSARHGAEQAAVDGRVLVEMGLGRAALAVEQPAAVAAQGGGARRPVDVLRFRHTCSSRCSRSQGLMTFMNSSCSTSLTSL